MAQVKTKPGKQYLVSVELLPVDADTGPLLTCIRNHLVAKCGYQRSRSSRMLIFSEYINKISIISPLSSSQALEKHLAALRDRLKMRELIVSLRRMRYKGVAYLSIGVIYTNAMTCTVSIPPDLVNFLSSTGLTVELVYYPGSED